MAAEELSKALSKMGYELRSEADGLFSVYYPEGHYRISVTEKSGDCLTLEDVTRITAGLAKRLGH